MTPQSQTPHPQPYAAPLPSDGPATRRGLSVVLPAYNEEVALPQTVAQCVEVLSVLAPDYEVIIVDDGSRDRTGELADDLAARNPRVRVVHNSPNRGYGGALVSGFSAATKELCFFMDADGQFDIHDLAPLLRLREQGHRVVLGYREHRQDPLPRLLNSRAWQTLVSLLFALRVRDLNCAFKLFDTNLVQVADVQAAGAMINAELLVKFSKLGLRFEEVPVRHFPRRAGSATGAHPRVILRAFTELRALVGELRRWSAPLPPEGQPVQPQTARHTRS